MPKENGLAPAAFTFELPGNQTLKGGRILSAAQKHLRMESLGIEQYLEPPFEAFRDLSPEDFVQKVLVECFRAKAVFCGKKLHVWRPVRPVMWRCCTPLCEPLGISVHIVPMAQYGAQAVSSTRIRAALEEGRLDDANAMLGAPYAIDWQVTHGKGVGTSRLGTPTVNQNYPPDALQPCTGVYLTRIWCRTAGGPLPPASAAAPRWMKVPMQPLPAKPMYRISPATCTGRPRCWNFTAIFARSANSVRCRNCRN